MRFDSIGLLNERHGFDTHYMLSYLCSVSRPYGEIKLDRGTMTNTDVAKIAFNVKRIKKKRILCSRMNMSSERD